LFPLRHPLGVANHLEQRVAAQCQTLPKRREQSKGRSRLKNLPPNFFGAP
jgi:hypothetical protein